MLNSSTSRDCNAFELRFESLFHAGRGLGFPCDAAGGVDLDALSERARINYFVARTTVGRDYSVPRVLRNERHSLSAN